MPEEKHKTIKKSKCPHLKELKICSSGKKKCEKCSEKQHLRLCTSCGKVFCCESMNAHDTEHFRKTGHPIIRPVHCDYDFLWCYGCKAYLE